MTEEFDNELIDDNSVDSIIAKESIVENSVVPPESAAEEAFAAAANAIPAAGGPIVVDPYAVLGNTATPPVTGATQTYAAPTASSYQGATYNPGAPYQPGAHYTSATHTGPTYPGQPANYNYGYGTQPYVTSLNGFSIAALACGVAGLVLAAPVIGSILGVVFGIIALNHIRRTGERGHGLAVAGIVTGAVGLLLGLTVIFGLLSMATISTFNQPTYWR